jgi:hypothetical protein
VTSQRDAMCYPLTPAIHTLLTDSPSSTMSATKRGAIRPRSRSRRRNWAGVEARHPQRLGEWLVEVVDRVFDGLIHGKDRARHRRVLERQLAIALGHRAAIERKSRSE